MERSDNTKFQPNKKNKNSVTMHNKLTRPMKYDKQKKRTNYLPDMTSMI
jgi:hypothetical protein